MPSNDRSKYKAQSSKSQDQSPKTKLLPLFLSALFDFVSRAYPGTRSTGDVEQICEAVLFENARGRARAIAAGADHRS